MISLMKQQEAQKGSAQVAQDKDILENTQNKIETRIYMGEKFGNEKN